MQFSRVRRKLISEHSGQIIHRSYRHHTDDTSASEEILPPIGHDTRVPDITPGQNRVEVDLHYNHHQDLIYNKD